MVCLRQHSEVVVMAAILTKQVREVGKFQIKKALPPDPKTPAFLFVSTQQGKIVPHLFVQISRKQYRNDEIVNGAADELERMIRAIVGNVVNDLYTEVKDDAEDSSV